MFLPLIQSVIFLACSATQSQTTVQNVPSCINNKIESFKKEPKQNPPRSVTEYTYKGKRFIIYRLHVVTNSVKCMTVIVIY